MHHVHPSASAVAAAAGGLVLTGLLSGVFVAGGCKGWHLLDAGQVPVVAVGKGVRPVISWTPAEAYELSVYEGPEDKNGFDVLWTAKMGGGYENELRSPVTFGVPPPGSQVRDAPPLESGRTYTVTVTRKDPKGSGDGFQNTRHRYVGKATFVAGD
jgi:hypothetical protein